MPKEIEKNNGRSRHNRTHQNIDVDKYKYGFTTDIESEKAPKGLSEEIVAFISGKKGEPEWMLDGGSKPIGAGST